LDGGDGGPQDALAAAAARGGRVEKSDGVLWGIEERLRGERADTRRARSNSARSPPFLFSLSLYSPFPPAPLSGG